MLQTMNFSYIFKDAFETFKVFEKVSVEHAAQSAGAGTKSLWQILNHLVLWQQYHLSLFQYPDATPANQETATWIEEQFPDSQMHLDAKVQAFQLQIDTIKIMLPVLDVAKNDTGKKIRMVQEMSLHLSFHLGEIVLLRRINGSYPPAHEMEAFLK
jgi:uncharacterized damage-inducible protein DinB